MAEFSSLVITDNGRTLIMKILESRNVVRFTKIATSDREYLVQELKEMAVLEGIRQESIISEVEMENTDTIRIHAVIPNTDISEGYYIKTVGLYAEDPEEGEILYGVSAEVSENGCYVPAFRNRTVSNIYFNLSVAVGNAENVILEVDPAATVTVKQLDKIRYPEYEESQELAEPGSGEDIFTIFGKIKRAVSELISHIRNKDNPHDVSAVQAGALPRLTETETGLTDETTLEELARLLAERKETYFTASVQADQTKYTRLWHDISEKLGETDLFGNLVINRMGGTVYFDFYSYMTPEIYRWTYTVINDRGMGDAQKIQSTDGDTEENVTTFEQAGERTNIVSGENHRSIFGKIARWFADLKAVAFSGSYNDLTDKPSLGGAASQVVANNDTTTAAGYVLDARVAKVHGDEIDALNTALTAHKTSGDHDGRYYTEAEVNNLLAGKSGTTHTHDERYYTEAEVNNLLAGKIATTASCNKNWNWSGQSGQPTWLWGGNDANNMYVYNPSNFRVSYATSAETAMSAVICTGNANTATNAIQAARADVATTASEADTATIAGICRFLHSASSASYENYGVGVQTTGTAFRPYTLYDSSAADNIMACGASASRWSQVIAVKGTINTSDRNYKKDIKPLTEQHMKFFMLLEPVSFMYKDSKSDRTHIGFIAQDVEAAMGEVGLSDLDFAGFCRDVKVRCYIDESGKEIEEPVLDDEGNPAYIYSLRYSEFIAINTYMIQNVVNRLEQLKKQNAELENRMEKLEKLMKA